MNRVALEERLEQTERNVSEAKRHVVRLRELMAEVQRGDIDIRLARNLVWQFERSLAAHICERNRLRRQLGL